MEPNATDKPTIRVLLVEDEFLIAAWVAEYLSERGFIVLTASNAGDALRHLTRGSIDILFTDINLAGGMDGVALARRARELSPLLPVIYASALAPNVASQVGAPGGVFLRKPYEPGAVARLIADAVQAPKVPAFA